MIRSIAIYELIVSVLKDCRQLMIMTKSYAFGLHVSSQCFIAHLQQQITWWSSWMLFTYAHHEQRWVRTMWNAGIARSIELDRWLVGKPMGNPSRSCCSRRGARPGPCSLSARPRPFSPKFLMGFCSDGPLWMYLPNLKFVALSGLVWTIEQ